VWAVKLRLKSVATLMPGMPGMGGSTAADRSGGQPGQPAQPAPQGGQDDPSIKPMDVLKGLFGR
jgi:hypothetical protein